MVSHKLSTTSFSSSTKDGQVLESSSDLIHYPKSNNYDFFHTSRFKICFLAMCLNVILFALDAFIITVSVPQIVGTFDSLDKIEWLNTAFFVPCAAAILVYSQLMTVISPRWVYLGSICVFEAGSAICGSAGSMEVLIFGRAVAGLGGAGMWNATFLIGGELIPFEKRPGYFGLFGVSYILASVMGPLVGGALTDTGEHGWRWCFYINLPIGGITLLLLLLTIPPIPLMLPFSGVVPTDSRLHRLVTLDWIGALLTLSFVICLGVGLQWGGISKSWDDANVMVVLVFAAVSFLALLAWSGWMGDKAMIPLSLLRRRHFAAGIWVSFFGYGLVVVYLYYLPLYFEAIKGKSATRAGVLLLGLQLSMSPVLIFAGKLGERTGHAKSTILIGSALLAVASGLFSLLRRNSTTTMIIAFEVIAGIGAGCVLNIMVVLVQADYLKEQRLVPHVTNVVNFWGFLGRIVGISTATSVFENKLRQGLQTIPELEPRVLRAIVASPEEVWTAVSLKIRDSVLDTYSRSLNHVWWLCFAFAIACLFVTLAMRNLNLKQLGEEAVRERREQGEMVDTTGYKVKTARDA